MNALTGAGHDPYDCTSQDCAVDFTEHLNDSIEGKRVGIIPRLWSRGPDARGQGRCSARRPGAAEPGRRAGRGRPAAPGRRHRRLLRHRPGRGVLQPGTFRRHSLRLSGGGLRQLVRPELAFACPRLWCRGQAPSDARRLPAELGRVRQVLLRCAKGPHAHHAGLRRRVCQGGHHPHARLAAHGL